MTCPTFLRHIAFQFLGDLLELPQDLYLLFERIESPAGNDKFRYGDSRFMGLGGPLGTNALSLSSRPRLHYIRPNA